MLRDLICLVSGHVAARFKAKYEESGPIVSTVSPHRVLWVAGWQPCGRCGRWYEDVEEAGAGKPRG